MPALVPLGAHTGKPPIPLKRPVLLVGSRNIAHLHLMSSKVSKAHALIINSDGKIYIRDLASRTKVFVNNKPVREADLQHGDQLRIGSFVFRMIIPQSWRTKPRDVQPEPGQLEVDGAELPVRLDERVALIGRRPTVDVALLEESASTAHAVIFDMGGRRFVRDLGSRTGTFINGKSIHQDELKFGDLLKIGETEFRYNPAPAIATGPVPVEPELAQSDLDELEDLVGTAPLMEEPPEVTAKRMEQEADAAATPTRQARPAAPVTPRVAAPPPPPPVIDEIEDSGAPIPMDLELDAPAAEDEIPVELEPTTSAARAPQPAPEPEALPIDDLSVEDDLPVNDLPVADDEAMPVVGEATTEDAEDVITTSQPLAPLELDLGLAGEPDAEPAEASIEATEADLDHVQPAATDEAVSGIDDLDLTPTAEAPAPAATVPAGIDELDLGADDELENGGIIEDPEATRALPPEFKPKAKKPPVLSEQIVEDEPLAEAATSEPAGAEDQVSVDAATDPLVGVEIAESADDTVALTGAAVMGEPDEQTPAATTDDLSALDLSPIEEAATDQAPVEPPTTDADDPAAAAVAPAADEKKSTRKRAPRKSKAAPTEKPAKAADEKPKRPSRRKKTDTTAPAVPLADATSPVDEASPLDVPVEDVPVGDLPVGDLPIDEEIPAVAEAAQDGRPADEPLVVDGPLVVGETLESTAPTPESAQALDLELDDVPDAPATAEALTDSGFDREVQSFVAESPEPIVEEADGTPATEAAATADEPDLLGATTDTPFELDLIDDALEPTAEAPPAAEVLPATADAGVPAAAEAESEPQWQPPAAAVDEFAALDLDVEDEEASPAAAPAPRAAARPAVTPMPVTPAAAEDALDDDADLIVEHESDVARGVDLDAVVADDADATGMEIAASPETHGSALLDLELKSDLDAVDAPAVMDAAGKTLGDADLDLTAVAESDTVDANDSATLANASATVDRDPAATDDEPAETFETGVNQWGFLGGTPLNLHDGPPPAAKAPVAPARPAAAGPVRPPPAGDRPRLRTPPPARGLPFGRKSFVADEASELDAPAPSAGEFADVDAAVPQINEVDVFSQLGAPPEDDPFFGKAAQFGLGEGAPATPNASPVPRSEQPTGATTTTDPRQKSQPAPAAAKPPVVAPPPGAEPLADDIPEWQPDAAEPVTADEGFNDLVFAEATDETADAVTDQALDELALADDDAGAGQAPPPMPPQTRNGAAGRTPAVLFGDEQQAAAKRKRRWFFSVPMLFGLMLAAMAAAGAAIAWKVPVYAQVEGRLQFANIAEKSGRERSEFLYGQGGLLADLDGRELSLRATAQAKLKEHYGDVPPGFLADGARYSMLAQQWRETWAAQTEGVLRVRLDSDDPKNDESRVHALLLALYDRNSRLLDQRSNAEHELKRIEADIAARNIELTNLQGQLELLNKQGARPITDAELTAMRREVAELERRWRAADERAKRVQGELERMRESAARTVVAEAGGGAGGADADAKVAEDDASIKEMEQRAADLTRRLEAAKVADGMEVDRTREAMDASIEALERQIEQVKDQMKDVPAMKGYVFAAKVMQDTTRSLVDELIHSQKQQLGTINELKRKLDEQRVARQNEVWANDLQLKDLSDLLDIRRRQYNAAVSSADDGQAKDKIAELEGAIVKLEQQIADRRKLLGNDMIYAEAIKGMEDLIAQSERRLEDDRRRADEQVTKMQTALAEQAPDLATLPEAQKKIAAELEKRLFEMNESRKAYAESLARAATDGERARRALEKELLDLQTKTDARRQALLAERRRTMTEQEQQALLKQMQDKAAELTPVQTQAQEAYAAFQSRQMELARVESQLQTAGESSNRREQITKELGSKRAELQELAEQQRAKAAVAAAAIYPMKPERDNVTMTGKVDDRPFYALVCVGSIALLFGLAMLAAHQAAARDAIYGSIPVVPVQVERVGDPLDDILPRRETRPPTAGRPMTTV